MRAATHRTNETIHPHVVYEPFDPKAWLITPKGMSQAMHIFDEKPAHYQTWRSRVLDHLMGCNQNWARVLELTEQQTTPLTRLRLATIPTVDAAHWISKEFVVIGIRLEESSSCRLHRSLCRWETSRTSVAGDVTSAVLSLPIKR